MAEAKMNAAHQCADCLRVFVLASTPVANNPRTRSYVLPELCNGCAWERLAKIDPPLRFSELLQLMWVVGD